VKLAASAGKIVGMLSKHWTSVHDPIVMPVYLAL
jgi:hypothetical protein